MKMLNYLTVILCLTAGAAEVRGDELGGIGVGLGTKGSNIVVLSIVPNSAAAAQKTIHVGDWIMASLRTKSLLSKFKAGISSKRVI